MYKSILVPVDIIESELTSKVIPHIEFYAKNTDAKITFIHVLPFSDAIVKAYSFGFDEFESQALKKVKELLEKLIASINIPRERVSYTIRYGNPRDEIISAVESNPEIDLIITGSRRPNITTHLLGSNATSIIRYAQVSVLVVR